MDERPMMIEMPIRIKAYEIDAVGIVSNIVYIKWFEDLRHEFLEKYYPYQEMMRSNISPVLAKTTAEYKAPLQITDNPIGRCWASKMRSAIWEITIEIATGSNIHCVGVQKGCFFDVEKKSIARTPERLTTAYAHAVGK